MRQWGNIRNLKRRLAALGLGVLIFQFPGGCQFDNITATSTVTLSGREVVINMIRGALLTPIDAFITQGVNELFDQLEDGE